MIKCENCQTETKNPKFCSQSCSAKYSNTRRMNKRFCQQCNKVLITHQKKYCSLICCAKSKHEELVNTKPFEQLDKKTIKKILSKKYGHKCSICNITEWQSKPLIMIMDHIDGNSENNKIENLRLICSNCDSQLSTYKCRNKGNGRHSRRERYKNGQSY